MSLAVEDSRLYFVLISDMIAQNNYHLTCICVMRYAQLIIILKDSICSTKQYECEPLLEFLKQPVVAAVVFE